LNSLTEEESIGNQENRVESYEKGKPWRRVVHIRDQWTEGRKGGDGTRQGLVLQSIKQFTKAFRSVFLAQKVCL